MNEGKSQPQVAFLAAALALLVLPLLVMFGLTALGMGVGMLSRMDRMIDGGMGWPFLALFVLWVSLVTGIVLLLAYRLIRRTPS